MHMYRVVTQTKRANVSHRKSN